MNRLLIKDEIPDYDLKAEALKKAGWETWYHDDNWIKTEWSKQGLKIDMMGLDTKEAYRRISDPMTDAELNDAEEGIESLTRALGTSYDKLIDAIEMGFKINQEGQLTEKQKYFIDEMKATFDAY